MTNQPDRFEWVDKCARAALIGTWALLALAVAATAATGVYFGMERRWDSMLLCVGGMLLELLAALCALVGYGLIKARVATETAANGAAARLQRVESLLESQTGSTRKLIELASLSDQTRSLLYRDREVEAFREVAHDYIVRQNFASAQSVIDSMEKNSGYVQEARALREELQASQKATQEERVNDAVGRVTRIIEARDWTRAAREVERLRGLFPANPRVAALPQAVETARTNHKRELLQAYEDAVKKNDVDHGIELLNELDRYLSPQEAAALEESARGVFKAKLLNLGVQFSINVADENWRAAVATGEEIIRAFPNSRMAYEVKMKMDQLKARAAETKA